MTVKMSSEKKKNAIEKVYELCKNSNKDLYILKINDSWDDINIVHLTDGKERIGFFESWQIQYKKVAREFNISAGYFYNIVEKAGCKVLEGVVYSNDKTNLEKALIHLEKFIVISKLANFDGNNE